MDPLDREKPWSFIEQVAVITLAIGILYVIIRFAVVVPDWGWQLILAVTVVGVVLYYMLAFRLGFRRRVQRASRQRALEFLFALLLVVSFTLPIALALFYFTRAAPP